jgi:hypothetical protein
MPIRAPQPSAELPAVRLFDPVLDRVRPVHHDRDAGTRLGTIVAALVEGGQDLFPVARGVQNLLDDVERANRLAGRRLRSGSIIDVVVAGARALEDPVPVTRPDRKMALNGGDDRAALTRDLHDVDVPASCLV